MRINDCFKSLNFGVVLSTVFLKEEISIYSVGDLIYSNSFKTFIYSEDSHVYISYPELTHELLADISSWPPLRSNTYLKFTLPQTELLISFWNLLLLHPSSDNGNSILLALSLILYTQSISTFFWLELQHTYIQIWLLLTFSTTKTPIQLTIISCMEYCNSS